MKNFVLLLLFSSLLQAQDMPLTQVLIDGEDWELVSEGHKITDAACKDAEGNFYFSDVAAGTTINKIDKEGKLSVFVKDVEKISGMQFGPDGKLYATQAGKFGRVLSFDKDGKMKVIAKDVQPNDLVVTHKGWIYFTETRKQAITSISPDGKLQSTKTSMIRPNGITLSPDQGTLAVSDHGGDKVWAYRIEADGSLKYEQPYMTMRLRNPLAASRGDGMCSDIHNRYYVTSEMGLQMYDPTGRMGGIILAPNRKKITSVAFAGEGLSYIYVCAVDSIYRRKTKSKGFLFYEKQKPQGKKK